MSGAAVRTAYRLNVSKTKLYRLAKQYYPEIGPMKTTAYQIPALSGLCPRFQGRRTLSPFIFVGMRWTSPPRRRLLYL